MRPDNVRPVRTPDHLRWTRTKIECGKELKGWIAGPVYGCEGHATPVFKPCHHAFTKGAKTCPWCAVPQLSAMRFQGYLPLYDDKLKRLVVCVNLDTAETCDHLKLLHPITLRKGKYLTAPITLDTQPWTTLQPHGRGVYHQPQDLVPWLVSVLWKTEGLSEWVECQPVVTDADAPAGVPPNTPPDPPADDAPLDPSALRAKLRSRGLVTAGTVEPESGSVSPKSNGRVRKPKK